MQLIRTQTPISFVFIRVHSWFETTPSFIVHSWFKTTGFQGAFTPHPRPLSPSRGEGCQAVSSGWKARATWNAAHPCPNAHLIRVHSCSFVVQNTISFVFIRVHSWFETTPSFVSIRVHSWFQTTPPFVSIRGSKPPPHASPFVVQNTTPFLPIRGSKLKTQN